MNVIHAILLFLCLLTLNAIESKLSQIVFLMKEVA